MLFACKKDNEEPPASIVGKWKQTAGVISPALGGITDYFSDNEPCNKDDIYEFKSNNTYESTEGATRCDPNDPNLWDSGAYSLSSDRKTLTWDGDNYNVLELSSSTLRISSSFTSSGVTYTTTDTYQRQ
ncbi:MAG: lipocalin family protein [Microscillaceae bacterium]|nr:lipocalin family protein [Microscillaceae bacterium]